VVSSPAAANFYRNSVAIRRCLFESFLLQWHLAVKENADNKVCPTHRKCPHFLGAAAAKVAAAAAVAVKI
jgi:hypothetical protein